MKKILFVCTGNTCRSPMAQGICNKIAGDNSLDLEAFSAGLATVTGLAVSENAVTVCNEIDIDISKLKSVSVYNLNLEDYSMIYTMSENHRSALIAMGAHPDRVRILSRGISDPYGGDLNVYRRCRDELYSAVNNAVKEL